MRKILIYLFFTILYTSLMAQKYTISGYVKDKENGEEQIGATVYIKELQVGASTNVYGFYTITVPKGNYTLIVSYIGYKSISMPLNLNQDMKYNIQLESEGTEIDEVVVSTEAEDKNVESLEMSTTKISMNTIKKIPALMGEIDVIKAIQLLPGVQTVGEGGSGFYVRGGAVDQNLILLDEATVYNASHLMGFFSVFNSDVVKDVKLYKGGIPAQYGGRLSSVLDVRMNEGNDKKFHAKGGVGTISSRLTLEAPIKKDKASFLVAGRRTYIDMLFKTSKDTTTRKSKLYFYDMNAKFNWKVNENNRVFVSGYFGRDVLNFGGAFGFDWGNTTLTTRWTHIFSDKLFLNVLGLYSNFDYHLGGESFSWDSKIKDLSGKADFEFIPNPKNTIKFGAQVIHHEFRPGKVTFTFGETRDSSEIQPAYALEYGLYLSNDHKINRRLSATYGVRYSLFQNIGPYTQYYYDQNYEVTSDTIRYEKGDNINNYGGFEPRAGVKYTLTDESSLKLSYNRMRQYLHLASNSTSSSPLDIWIPSSPNVKPQIADQVALGYFRNFKQNMFEGSFELYYKYMDNAIDFKDHAQLLLNKYLEGELRYGVSRAYGAEFMVRKNKGKLSGWVSYTLARSERQIEEINNGNTYPTKYDKRHNLSVVGMYTLSKKWDFGGTFVYSTGAAITAPIGKYEFQNTLVPIYSTRNGARMPAYHRLDLSATLTPQKENRKYNGEWVFSIYNVYARKNPYNITFKQSDENPNVTVAEQLTLFSILPSITYNFKF